MSGEELYAEYVRANDEFSVGVDDWYDLNEEDHAIWETMARNMENDRGS